MPILVTISRNGCIGAKQRCCNKVNNFCLLNQAMESMSETIKIEIKYGVTQTTVRTNNCLPLLTNFSVSLKRIFTRFGETISWKSIAVVVPSKLLQ